MKLACKGMSNIRIQFHFSPHHCLHQSWHLTATLPSSKSCATPMTSCHELERPEITLIMYTVHYIVNGQRSSTTTLLYEGKHIFVMNKVVVHYYK